jgi:hypothetical protein
VLLLGPVAGASTAVAMDVPQLTRRSDVVVRGAVAGQASAWAPGGRRIVTETRIRVASVLKGAPPREVLVVQPGGVVDGIGQSVTGAARFRDGEDVLLFLEHRGGDRYQVVGMAMGKFNVRKNAGGAGLEAVQDGMDGVLLLDPATRAPTTPSGAVPLATLEAAIRAAAPSLPAPPAPTPGTKTP